MSNQPIDHSHEELPVDGLLDEQTRTEDSEDELWAEVLKFGQSIYTEKEWFDTMKSKYSITRKQV